MQITKLPASFVGLSGRFYVLRNEGLTNPSILKQYAVYSSTDAYNGRTETPFYICAEEAMLDFDYEVKIYPDSLTTTPPACEPDRDETDYGLTPERNIWNHRFRKAREGRRYAA